MQRTDFKFISPKFEAQVVTLKGKKEYFVSGDVTNDLRDDVGDIMTEQAQDDLVQQLKGKIITIDIDHENWVENGVPLQRPKSKTIPVGKVVEAKKYKEDGIIRTWIKVKLNSNLGEKFNVIWNSIQDKFLHSFSLGGWILDAVTTKVKGVTSNLISKYLTNNITLTGNPIGNLQPFVPSVKAALKAHLARNKAYDKDGGHAHDANNTLGDHNHPEIENAIRSLWDEFGRVWDRIYESTEDTDEPAEPEGNVMVVKDETIQVPPIKTQPKGKIGGNSMTEPDAGNQPANDVPADNQPVQTPAPAGDNTPVANDAPADNPSDAPSDAPADNPADAPADNDNASAGQPAQAQANSAPVGQLPAQPISPLDGPLNNVKAELTKKIDEQGKEIARLKALLEKPVLKAKIHDTPDINTQPQVGKDDGPLSLI